VVTFYEAWQRPTYALARAACDAEVSIRRRYGWSKSDSGAWAAGSAGDRLPLPHVA
jgi:hypothetical protein